MVKLKNIRKFNQIYLFAISATYRPSPMGLWCTRWEANRKMRMERRSNIKHKITNVTTLKISGMFSRRWSNSKLN